MKTSYKRFEKQAKTLVKASSLIAVSSYTKTLSHFPILSKVDSEQWDFFVTIAGVFIGASRLSNLQLDGVCEDSLMNIVAIELCDLSSDGIRAFEDCKTLFEEKYDQLAASPVYQTNKQFLSADALGFWIVWNLFGHQPQDNEEIKLIRFIGTLITHSFFDWWK